MSERRAWRGKVDDLTSPEALDAEEVIIDAANLSGVKDAKIAAFIRANRGIKTLAIYAWRAFMRVAQTAQALNGYQGLTHLIVHGGMAYTDKQAFADMFRNLPDLIHMEFRSGDTFDQSALYDAARSNGRLQTLFVSPDSFAIMPKDHDALIDAIEANRDLRVLDVPCDVVHLMDLVRAARKCTLLEHLALGIHSRNVDVKVAQAAIEELRLFPSLQTLDIRAPRGGTLLHEFAKEIDKRSAARAALSMCWKRANADDADELSRLTQFPEELLDVIVENMTLGPRTASARSAGPVRQSKHVKKAGDA